MSQQNRLSARLNEPSALANSDLLLALFAGSQEFKRRRCLAADSASNAGCQRCSAADRPQRRLGTTTKATIRAAPVQMLRAMLFWRPPLPPVAKSAALAARCESRPSQNPDRDPIMQTRQKAYCRLLVALANAGVVFAADAAARSPRFAPLARIPETKL